MIKLTKAANNDLTPASPELPPILDGHHSPAMQQKTRRFYFSVAVMFEAWLQRSEIPNTQRSYRAAVTSFIRFMEINWPTDSWRLLQVTIGDVRDWRTHMQDTQGQAPKTLNHRISSLSGFYSFMREVAADTQLPIVAPNPAHKDFIKRPVTDPVDETESLSVAQAQRLVRLPDGDSLLVGRDRATIAFYLYSRGADRDCLPDVSQRFRDG